MEETQNFYNNILSIAGSITIYSTILPILFGFWKWKSLNKPIKLVLYYFLLLLFMEALERFFYWYASNYYEQIKVVLDKFQISDTSFLGITHALPDFIFVGWIFSFVLYKQLGDNIQKISWFLFIFSIVIYFYIDGYNNIGVVNPTIDRLYLIIIPVIYLYYLSKSPPILSLWKNPFFLFALGLLLPNLLSFFLSFFGDKLEKTDFPAFVKFSIVRNIFTVFAQVFFIMVFYHARFAKFLINKNN